MWEAFRVLDEQIQSLSGLWECLVEREADACAAADCIDQRVIQLTKKYKRLLQDKTEAEEWVADVALLGVDTLREKKRENDAQMVVIKRNWHFRITSIFLKYSLKYIVSMYWATCLGPSQCPRSRPCCLVLEGWETPLHAVS